MAVDKRFFWPKVLQVLPADKYKVYAYLNDGSVRLFDAAPLLQPGTVFEPLMDMELFKSKLAVINDTIAWDMGGGRNPEQCIDIDPLVIWALPAVGDPLERPKVYHNLPSSAL